MPFQLQLADVQALWRTRGHVQFAANSAAWAGHVPAAAGPECAQCSSRDVS